MNSYSRVAGGFISYKLKRLTKKGGRMANKNPGNFANDRERASRAGRKGAQNQPIAAKAKGGRNSRRGSTQSR